MKFLEAIRDLIWPRRCVFCSKLSDRPGRFICSECLMRLPVVPSDGLCRCCGREAIGLNGEFLCDECSPRKVAYDRVGSACRFEGDARQLMLDFKFHGALFLRDDLTDFLEAVVRTRFRVERLSAVVPMPSTLFHRWLRGYSQTDILATALARRLNLPCVQLLRRTGTPARQSTLSAEKRAENVRGTFALRKTAVPKGTILLVDDILTTGATLSEAARTLKSAGIPRVFAVTFTHPSP